MLKWEILMLLYPTVADIRKKQFYIFPVIVYGIAFLLYRVYTSPGWYIWVQMIEDVLPGMMILVIGKLTKEAIGYGDAGVLIAMGIMEGWRGVLMILLFSLSLAGAMGLILLLARKAGRKSTLPFVPFLLSGTIMYHCLLR